MGRVLVTGAGRGIGLELARQLAGRGDEVIATCRRASPALEELDARVIEGVDVADETARARLARELGGERLDVLVHNAGVLEPDELAGFELDRLRRQLEVNALAPLALTRALLPCLGEGAKVALVTSLMGSMGDNRSGGYYGYRMSKAALNAAGVSLARDLAPRGVSVVLIHPGMVATDMTGGRGIPVERSARGVLQRIDGLVPADSGSLWHAEGRRLPW